MLLRNLSLQTKRLLAFTLVNLISIAAFISYAQYAKSLDIRAQMDNRLRAAAHAVPRLLGDGYLERARSADGLKEGEYLGQVRNLGEYAAEVDLKYAYTMMVDAGGQVQFDEYTDSYGSFRSIFLPLRTVGGQPFVVGVDVTLDSLQQAIHDSLPSLLLIGAATLGVSLLLSWLAARMLVHGILLLTGQLNRIADHRDLSP